MGRENPVYEQRVKDLEDSFEIRIRRLLGRAMAIGFDCRVVSAYRDPAEQLKLYKAGITKARPGYSWHNFRLAADLGLFRIDGSYIDNNDEGFKLLGPIGEGFGLVWGGRWGTPDMPHFQQSGIPVTPTAEWRKRIGL